MSKNFLYFVDNLNDWTGKIIRWLIIPMTIITAYEVIARYIFSAPTKWAWDINTQLLGVFGVLAGGYALLHNSHVVIDIFSSRMNPRKKAALDLFLWILFFFVFAIVVWQWGAAAWESTVIRETSNTALHAIIFPLKITIAVGMLLLLLQGVASFIRNLSNVIHPDKESDK